MSGNGDGKAYGEQQLGEGGGMRGIIEERTGDAMTSG